MAGKKDLEIGKTLNPDADYVLRGQSAQLWEKTGSFNNSSITAFTGTTRRLSQHMVFNPDNYRQNTELDLCSQRQRRTKSACPNFAKKHYLKSYTGEAGQSCYEMAFDGKAKPYRTSDWYINPIHPSTLKMSPERAKHDHMPGKLGSVLATHCPEHHSFTKVATVEELKNYPLTPHYCTSRFFPVTLGSSKDKRDVMPPNFIKWKMIAKSPYVHESILNKSRFVSQSFDPAKHVENLYLTSQEDPIIAPGSISTPFDTDLALLQKESLWIEEDRLLKQKRFAEMERIRGPKLKWYELKNPEFHYESHKNTEMIKREKDWDNLMHYREMLHRASTELLRASTEYRAQNKPVFCY